MLDSACNNIESSSLTAAIVAKESEDLSFLEVECEVFEHYFIRVLVNQVLANQRNLSSVFNILNKDSFTVYEVVMNVDMVSDLQVP